MEHTMSNKDSIDRLIDYTQTIKPYHTKIYEVLTNYTYEEDVNIAFTDVLTTMPVECECDPNMIYAGIGWDTQPYGKFNWILLNTVDTRGNPMYDVVTDTSNSMWDAPRDPPLEVPEECCTVCEVWLCEDVGWDTQPYGLYSAMDSGTVDELGDKIYTTMLDDNNCTYDGKQECPDAEEE